KSTARTMVTNIEGGMSRHSEALSRASTSAGSDRPRAISRSSVRTITMRSAAGIPFPDTSPIATAMRSPMGRMSKKSPPTMVEGLRHVVVGPALEAPDLVGELGLGREHDDGNVGGGPMLADPLERLQPVQARHHDVEDDEVGRLRLDGLDGLEAVVRRPHLEAGAAQGHRQHRADVDLVVHHEDA